MVIKYELTRKDEVSENSRKKQPLKLPLHRLGLCAASVILALGLLALALSVVQGAGSLTRITTFTGTSTIAWSVSPDLSADGTKMVFSSYSDFLGEGISQYHLWLYDTTTMTFTRITTESNLNYSFGAISADGKKIAFNNSAGIWLYDTTTKTRSFVIANSSNRESFKPSLNGDGTKIAFTSDSDFLNQGIPDEQFEIWLYDTATMTYTRVTTASHPDRDSGRKLTSLKLSIDGKKIAFESNSDFLNQGIPNDHFELWLYDTATMTVTRVTTASSSIRTSELPTLNSDGTKVAFVSDADFLGQGIPRMQWEIWLYDTPSHALTRVTTASDSERAGSYAPNLNADGTKLAFVSDSDFLGQGIPRGQTEIWVYDTVAMTLTRVTTAAGSGIRSSEDPSMNADGTKIAFAGDSDFLGQGIPEMQKEIWLYSESNQSGAGHSLYLPVLLKQAIE